jgi:hypothetical protein
MKTQTLFHPPIFKENKTMNTISKNSFRQKMFKCTVMIIILLQTACAANFAKLGDDPDGRTAPKRSKLAANGSGSFLTKFHPNAQRRKVESMPASNNAGAALTCGFDRPEEVSARPKVQPATAVRFPLNAQLVRDEEQYNLQQAEETLQQAEETLQQVEEALRQVEEALSVIERLHASPLIAATTITGAAIGGVVAQQSAKDNESDSKEVIQGVVTGAEIGAAVGITIETIIALHSLKGALSGWY